MARLGVLRGGDLRCLSASFMVVVFFCCVFMLSLQPSNYPVKLSMVDLPKDEVVREQSIPALAPTSGQDSNNPQQHQNAKVAGSVGKRKGEQKGGGKVDKKAMKAKWIKDELPKKLYTGRVRNNTKLSSRQNGSQDVPLLPANEKNLTEAELPPPLSSLQPLSGQADPSQPKVKNLPEPSPQREDSQHISQKSKPSPQSPNHNSASTDLETPPTHHPTLLKVKPESHQPSASAAEESPWKAPLHPKSSFSNLNEVPVRTFLSPFIENRSQEEGEEEKMRKRRKVITWHRAGDERALNRLRKALESCPDPQCRLVYPLPDGVRADAVIFEDDVDDHHHEYYGHESVPARASHDQVFVLHTMRPPSSPSTSGGSGPWVGQWRSSFNWTWSYRKDSDIWQPFGLLKGAKKVKPLDYFEAVTKSKGKAVAWIPRTCPPPNNPTPSKRTEFVEELRKHVHISEFGPCLNKTCGKAGTSCSDTLTKKFFFLLAVEDYLCPDHVTEVFYRAWQEKTHVLPVVRGGADYAAYFPEGTYIDVDWFDSAKQLAEFMVELVASRKIYSQLLWRKAHWVKSTKRPDEVSLCKLCHKLHEASPSDRQWYSDIRSWYKDSVCKDTKPVV